VKEINAQGGTLGRKWETIVADSRTDPRVAISQAHWLLREKRVDFLVGTFSSAERNAVGPLVTYEDKLLLYPTFYEGQQQEYYPGVCNKNIFMFGPDPRQQFLPHLEYMVQTFGCRFYLVGLDYVWPRAANRLLKESLDKLQGEIVGETYFPLNTQDFRSEILSITAIKPSIIFLTLAGDDTNRFRKQLYAAGVKKDLVVWSIDSEESATMDLGPSASCGDFSSFDYFWCVDHPNNIRFRRRFHEFYPDVIMDTVGVAMYNAAHMLANAIRQAGSIELEAVTSALEGMDFEMAPQGRVWMRKEDHQLILPSYLMKVRKDWTGPDDMFELIQMITADQQDNKCYVTLR